MGIHRLLRSSCCLLNINTATTRQLIRTARTLEAEWWQVCGEAWARGQSAGRIGAAEFHNVTARSRLARTFTLMNCLFL